MQKLNVLYLSYDGLTDPLGQSQILPYIIGLSKHEYEFTVISFEKPNAFVALSNGIKVICSENKINWVPLKYHKRPPILSTLFDIWMLWSQTKKTHRKKKLSIIHCRSYITSLIGLRAKNKWGIKFIFDMRGFWADERVEGGLWNLRNPIFRLVYNFFKKNEMQFITQSDHIVSLTHNAKHEIESWRIGNSQIRVIPTCVDLDLFDPSSIKKEDQIHLRKKLGITENDFVLLYLGSWGTWYLTKEMLGFFSLLKKENPNAKFLIVSPDKIDLEKYENRENVIITRSSRQGVPIHISLADLSICFIKPSFSKKASAATKLGEIMAMELPIIANGGWGDIDWFAEMESGILKIDLKNMQVPDCNRMKRQSNNRTFATSYFSLKRAIAQYKKIYQTLADA